MKTKAIILLIVSYFFLTAASCDGVSKADKDMQKQTDAMVSSANQAVGMPNITNFTEKRFAKLIYELKDSNVTTFTYFMDLNGGLHFLCESVGFGMPASVQYVNPQRKIGRLESITTIPQPEPNGLFMPEGLDATYVLCSDGKGSVKPVYTEPKIIVSPFKLQHKKSLR